MFRQKHVKRKFLETNAFGYIRIWNMASLYSRNQVKFRRPYIWRAHRFERSCEKLGNLNVYLNSSSEILFLRFGSLGRFRHVLYNFSMLFSLSHIAQHYCCRKEPYLFVWNHSKCRIIKLVELEGSPTGHLVLQITRTPPS